MNDFSNAKQSNSLSVKLWRGERMCLVGMDVNSPEDDFVGFSIEVKSPGSADFMPLRNRIAFSYDKPADQSVDGYRNFSSLEAPFQKFRWVHFPYEPKAGTYTYRVTKQHMPSDGKLKAGDAVTLDIPLDQATSQTLLRCWRRWAADCGRSSMTPAATSPQPARSPNRPSVLPRQLAEPMSSACISAICSTTRC